MDCYKCKHRRNIPGDAHSSCRHPEVVKAGIADNVFGGMADCPTGKSAMPIMILKIKGGGLTWPANYNPVFVTNCKGFDGKVDSP